MTSRKIKEFLIFHKIGPYGTIGRKKGNAMATIDERQWKNGEFKYRVRIRHQGIPTFTITFSDCKLAKKWIEKHAEKYKKDPKPYLEWIRLRRLWKYKSPVDTLELTH